MGIEAHVDGVVCPIVDISRSAVRVVKPDGFLPRDRAYDLVFDIDQPGVLSRYRVEGHLIRCTDIYFVLGYQAPIAQWEELLRSLDCFESLQLAEI